MHHIVRKTIKSPLSISTNSDYHFLLGLLKTAGLILLQGDIESLNVIDMANTVKAWRGLPWTADDSGLEKDSLPQEMKKNPPRALEKTLYGNFIKCEGYIALNLKSRSSIL